MTPKRNKLPVPDKISAAFVAVPQVLVILASMYVFNLGGTWRGITTYPYAQITVFVFGGLIAAWYWQRGSALWHRTFLDLLLPIWGFVLGANAVANREAWDQIAVGLWFICAYVVVWYILQDIQARKLVNADHLLNLLLLAAVPALIFAVVEFTLNCSARVSGTLENPNNLGALMVLIIPLMVERLIRPQTRKRWLLAGYLLAVIIILIMTGSRGAILGVTSALLTVGIVQYRAITVRILFALIYIAIVVFLFNLRGDNGRIPIYNNEFSTFLAYPLTGTGLFTVRTAPYQALTPGGTVLYSHNLFLHVARELGVLGLIALSVSVVWLLRTISNLRSPQQLWAFAAIIGTGIHQLLDFPIMMPSLALYSLVVLTIALPAESVSTSRNYASLVAIGAAMLLVIGIFNAPLIIR